MGENAPYSPLTSHHSSLASHQSTGSLKLPAVPGAISPKAEGRQQLERQLEACAIAEKSLKLRWKEAKQQQASLSPQGKRRLFTSKSMTLPGVDRPTAVPMPPPLVSSLSAGALVVEDEGSKRKDSNAGLPETYDT